LSIDVMNDQGQANVADVIKACDYILANKTKYNIKVANFSLHSVNRASVLFDPLDQAVEKLWLSGVVVVAASGNYGIAGKASGVNFAPGNDPFVITVGVSDIGTSVKAGDDTVAPWSAGQGCPDGHRDPLAGDGSGLAWRRRRRSREAADLRQDPAEPERRTEPVREDGGRRHPGLRPERLAGGSARQQGVERSGLV
jgi:hypothetical protein